MSLSLAVPCWNDRPGLLRLLAEVRRLGGIDAILVVDDASDTALDAAELETAAAPVPLRLLRQETRRGAGAARNRALEAVETEHLLFFDSDDLPTAELPPLLADLAGRDFDFCLFKHHDSRVAAWGRWGQTPDDEALWRLAGAAASALTELTPAQAAVLAGTVNYPWNKLYRTGFLREHGIRCTETPVHNDIELHWTSFLHGRRVLASDRIAARHFVAPGGGRLTNVSGRERLTVFDTLDRVCARLAAGGAAGGRLLGPFLRFAGDLLDWIGNGVAPEVRAEFDARARDFLRRRVPPGTFARLAAEDPLLALRINLRLAEAAP